MNMTLAEKIIARAGGRDSVEPDEVLWVDVDLAMTHDSSGPRRIWPGLKKLGVGVWDPERLVIVADHFVPAQDIATATILQTTRDFVETFGISRFHEAEGISHTIVVEKAYARPGMLYVGGDSHSLTAGVLGCLAIGVGSTDMLGIVATGTLLVAGHILEVVLWALTYAWVGVAPTETDLVYFAFGNYTTLGYGDVLPVEQWHLLGPMTALNGIMLMGWSTALIIEILRRTGHGKAETLKPAPSRRSGRA